MSYLTSLVAMLAAGAPGVSHPAQHVHAPPAEPAPPPAAPSPAPAEPQRDDPAGAGHDHSLMAPEQSAPTGSADSHAHHAMPAPQGAATNAGTASGTALLPSAAGGAHDGLHLMAGDWMVMAHGYLWGAVTDQGGPRGDTQAFVQSMAMVTASRPISERARVELRSMFSLEPLMGRRGYPNLFAAGETANGRALVDRQHPHDLFMELAARVDVDIAPGATAFVYGGPVGEPALGPPAFMHRGSARYQVMSPIAHHWFDSTHITYGVATAGLRTRAIQVEGSIFTGREPDEERWGFDTPRFDSWSFRATLTPSPHWTAQVSYGRLETPETLHPGQDEARTTASVHYARDGVSAMIAFASKNRVPGPALNAWVAEANWDLDARHTLFARGELVENDELFPDHAHPLHDQRFRVGRIEGGYAYRIPLTGSLALAIGGTVAGYLKPEMLDPYYGRAPVSVTGFAKLSLGR